MIGIILSRIYSIHSNSSMFVEFFKTIKIYLKQKKKIQDVCPYITKKLITKRLYVRLQFWGCLVCFHLEATCFFSSSTKQKKFKKKLDYLVKWCNVFC
jgi:hypothetical protein